MFFRILVTASLLLSCRTVSTPSDVKIINGEKVKADDVLAKSVVVIATKGPDNVFRATCTATLVGEDLLLTAAHCMGSPSEYVAWFGTDAVNRKAEIPVSKFERHPEYYVGGGPAGASSRDSTMFDIAWLRLAKNAPEGFEVLPVLANDNALQSLPKLTIVGGGKTAANCPENNCTGELFKIDLSVIGTFHNKFLSNVIAFEGLPTQGVCFGDSGGPALIKDGHRNLLAGVANGTNSAFTGQANDGAGEQNVFECVNSRTLYTSLPGYIDWIEKTSGTKLLRDSAVILAKAADDSLLDEMENPKTLEDLIRSSKPKTAQYNTLLSLYGYVAHWQNLKAQQIFRMYSDPAYAAQLIAPLSSVNRESESTQRVIFTISEPKVLSYLPALRHLRIANFIDNEKFFPVLATLPELKTLEIKPEVSLPVESAATNDYFRKLTKLKTLAINSPRSPLDCNALRHLKSLRSLTISFCPLYEGTKNRYEFLKNFAELENRLKVSQLSSKTNETLELTPAVKKSAAVYCGFRNYGV